MPDAKGKLSEEEAQKKMDQHGPSIIKKSYPTFFYEVETAYEIEEILSDATVLEKLVDCVPDDKLWDVLEQLEVRAGLVLQGIDPEGWSGRMIDTPRGN